MRHFSTMMGKIYFYPSSSAFLLNRLVGLSHPCQASVNLHICSEELMRRRVPCAAITAF